MTPTSSPGSSLLTTEAQPLLSVLMPYVWCCCGLSSFVSASCVATSPIPPWCLSSNFASSVQSARPRLDHGHRASSSPPWTQLLFCHCGHPAILVCRSPSLSLIPRYRVPYSISQPFPVPSICAALTRHRR
jgi:hypothetical protein|uniref:Uncharacterized protein n=1 Tax=Zea mays TaxID=4577 RepID=A0A804PG73_MAIZE